MHSQGLDYDFSCYIALAVEMARRLGGAGVSHHPAVEVTQRMGTLSLPLDLFDNLQELSPISLRLCSRCTAADWMVVALSSSFSPPRG
jgi:hypothetical protein